MRLLVAESHQRERERIGRQLGSLGHIVDFAESGTAAAKQFRSQSYDLVIVNVELEVVNGVELSRTIRSWELMQGFEPTPIIALNTTSSELVAPSELSREFTDYLIKPFDQTQLFGVIHRHARSSF